MANDSLNQLPDWLKHPNSFPDRFLGQSCPLLEAARETQQSGRQQELIALVTGDAWQRFLSLCDSTWRKGAGTEQHRPSVVLKARGNLVLAAMGHDSAVNLHSAVQQLQSATNSQFVPQLTEYSNDATRFDSTEIFRRLRTTGTVVEQFRQLAIEFGGWNSALLSTAAAYAEIFSPAPAPTHEVKTHLLFALGQTHGGQVARLTLQRLDFDTDAGGGACYPDPVSITYIKSHACFQEALQQAWWREVMPQITNCRFDIRWSLQFVGDPRRHNDDADPNLRDLRTQQMLPLSGPSAGMAFACAFRALRLTETLDPHMAITADFAAHFDETNSDALPVGSVPDKLRAELERAGIDEVLTSSDDEYFTNEGIQPDTDGVRICQPQRGKLKLIGLPDLDAFYKRASRHARLTTRVKKHLARRAMDLLQSTCNPYVRSSLSDRQPGDPSKQEPSEVPVPLSDSQVNSVLLGQLDGTERLRLLAESGLGKSTLLIEAEHLIASNADSRIPLRLGAGPASCSKDDLGRWTRLPLLSDFDWQKNTPDLLSDLAERLLGHILPVGSERTEWFQQAVDRGEVVFLLDSLDQTDKALKFDKFSKADGVRKCPLLLSARPETRRTKSQGYAGINWQTLWVDPFDDGRIRKFWCDDPLLVRLVVRLLRETDWKPLREVPVLLQQMKRLAQKGLLENLPNREAVYHRTLEMLAQHGHAGMEDAGHHQTAQDDLFTVEQLLSEIAWITISLESKTTGNGGAGFTGELGGAAYSQFAKSHRAQLDALDQLNVTTRQTYLDEFGQRYDQFAWRHFSFCEWFAGLHLASLTAEEQEACIKEHALDERWAWIVRFAMSAAIRQQDQAAVDHLATSLLSYGAPLLLWTCIDKDHEGVTEELDTLCRWFVHRDCDSWEWEVESYITPWAGRVDESDRPVMNDNAAAILKRMFAVDECDLRERRDSRWLNPAWQLVQENLPSDDQPNESCSPVQKICREIRDCFLSEFETRVCIAAQRNQGRFRADWHSDDQGLLQLAPDDVLLQLGVLPQQTGGGSTEQQIRNWPAATIGNYEQRRDTFNGRLTELGVNFCLCPPRGWEHPHYDADGSGRHPRECDVEGTRLRRKIDGDWVQEPIDSTSVHHFLPETFELQRTPVTNLQFEAFDPSHRRWRQSQWYRPEMEDKRRALDDHPAVEVSWHQAQMMCIWLTGRGTFGTFRLPFEEDWEACCRAGRDRGRDEFGIPWCDEQQRPVLDSDGNEQFCSLSSHGANFAGGAPHGRAEKGPYFDGTVPVGQYPANGFGAADQHGQVGEWCETEYAAYLRDDELFKLSLHCIRGGNWKSYGGHCRTLCGTRNDVRSNSCGFRVSRTK